MLRLPGRPVTFLLTGFTWLLLSSLVGTAILVGLVRGTPLPSWLRLAHTHAALVGGVAQMILGGFLVFIPPLLMTGQKRRDSHPLLFLAINSGALGMVAGFGFRNYLAVGAGGLLVVASFLWVARDAWTQARKSLNSPPLNLWFYAIALLALFGGLACGETMAFNLTQQSYGYVRLAHIHLNILGFITLAIVGTMHNLLPTVLNAPLYSPTLARAVLLLLPLGLALLIGGFLNSSVIVEMAAGGVLVATAALYAINLFRTWLASSRKGNAASDHLLIGTFFLLVTLVLGILVAANNLSDQPVMPFGSLHLMAYTHIALIGFVFQTIIGALSHLLPITLAVQRVQSNKKRGPYLDRLTTIINRWRTVQIGGLSLGTMGLALLASLTWNMPLSSLPVQVATWSCVGLLLGSLTLFSVKLVALLSTSPEEEQPHTT
ncbi:cbb3-type cytochrome c oxidase subunit I [Nitrospira sp. NS4]|uniref:cbb3-type cytochrome c oxidase subunit I n=1 Tax=Nitrospira sp. NS4 TaxID=3414498 RepID=UPI003C2B6CF0